MEAPQEDAGSGQIITGRGFLWNVFLNLVGQLLPLLAAIVAIPPLLTILGSDRLGVLAMAWGILGYFSLFDLGLGRAVTQRVALHVGLGERELLSSTVWTALALMTGIGVIGGLLCYAIAPWLVGTVLHAPASLTAEMVETFQLIALAIPVLVQASGLRGVLEGLGMFGIVNLIRIPIGVLTFVLPLLVAHYTNDMAWVTASLLVLRIAGLIVNFIFCLRVMPELRGFPQFRRAQFAPLLVFGGWMTVSNVIGPLMVYLDRFLIGAVISIAAVSYYVVPYELVTKLWIIPAAIVTVLFPGFAATLQGGRERTSRLYYWGIKATFLGLVPLTLPLLYFSPELIQLWIGKTFAHEGARVAQWLAVGVLVNSFAQIAFALLQGVGRPDFTAKLHLVELPLYVIVLYMLTKKLGVEGAAIAWTMRVIIDAGLLMMVARRFANILGASALRITIPLVYLVGVCLGGLVIENVATRGLMLFIGTGAFILIGWFVVLNRDDRGALIQWIKLLASPQRGT